MALRSWPIAVAAGSPRPTTSPTTSPNRPRPDAEGVVPVAADVQPVVRGVVPRRDLEARVARRPPGEHARLERRRDVPLVLVEARVLDGEGGALGEVARELQLRRRERRPTWLAEQAQVAEHAAGHGEGQHELPLGVRNAPVVAGLERGAIGERRHELPQQAVDPPLDVADLEQLADDPREQACALGRADELALVLATLGRVEDGHVDRGGRAVGVPLHRRVDERGQAGAVVADDVERDLLHGALQREQRRVVRLVVDAAAAREQVGEAAAHERRRDRAASSAGTSR